MKKPEKIKKNFAAYMTLDQLEYWANCENFSLAFSHLTQGLIDRKIDPNRL